MACGRGIELVIDIVLLAVFLGGKHGAAMFVGFADDSRFDILWVHGLRIPIGFIAIAETYRCHAHAPSPRIWS